MKKVIFAAFFLLISQYSNSQCFLERLPEDEAQDLIDNAENKSSGNYNIDQWFSTEVELMSEVLGISTDFFFFDDSESANALATCSCSKANCDGVVKFGETLLSEETYELRGGEDAVRGILAHELAHIMQCRNEWFARGKEKELHADFMAGYLMGKRSRVLFTNIGEFANSLFDKGDYDFQDASHHGTPEERVRYMTLGSYYVQLNADQAYEVGKNLVTGNTNAFDINGIWSDGFGQSLRVWTIPGGMNYQNTQGGYIFFASKIAENVFRMQIPQFYPNGQVVINIYTGMPVIADVWDFTVINEDELIVNSASGQVYQWEK